MKVNNHLSFFICELFAFFPMVTNETKGFYMRVPHFYTPVKQEVMEGHNTVPWAEINLKK